jgi:multiple sugar transport system substrate-binding protein
MDCTMPFRRTADRMAALALAFAIAFLAGCPRKEPVPSPVPPDTGKPIRLLVIDDPAMAAAIERTWRSRSEAPLEVLQRSSADLGAASRLGADAVIYPSGLLGALAERGLLFPLTAEMQEEGDLRQGEVFDMLRLREVRWGESVYGVSFGSPVFLLAYRADLLEQMELKPPATWDEYRRVAARLHEMRGEDGKTAAIAEAWAPGWSALTLLARAAPYVRHRDQYSDLFDFTSMKPLIDGPPFVRALEEMTAGIEYASPDSLKSAPHDAFRAVAEGRAAMALAWPPPAESEPGKEFSRQVDGGEDAAPLVRWAELPGSPDVYSVSDEEWEQRQAGEPQRIPLLSAAGRLGSVTRESSRSRAALHVLAILSAEQSREVAAASPATTLYRQSHMAAISNWYPAATDEEEAPSYAAAAQESLTRGVWLFSPRVPGRDRYLAALDEAVQKALKKELSPKDALAQAAKEWEAITEDFGRSEQLQAYRRSLGLEP